MFYTTLSQASLDEYQVEKLVSSYSYLLQNLSHEFRTPLQIILGYVKLLEDQQLGQIADEQALAIQSIDESANRLLSIFLKLEALYSVDRNRTLESVNLAKLIQKQLSNHQEKFTLSNIICELITHRPDLEICGVAVEIELALNGLIENAIKFMPNGGVIRIRLYERNGYAYLMIRDQGIGINQQDLPLVFKPFYQVDASGTRLYGGLGLGLTAAKSIIHDHGGSLIVTSHLGRGTTFLIKLPLSLPEHRQT